MNHVQQRDGRWCIADLCGKHGRVRTIPMPAWVKVAIDAWTAPASVVDGHVFRPVKRGDKVQATCCPRRWSGRCCGRMPRLLESQASRPTIVVAQPRNSAGRPAARSSRFNFYWATRVSRRRNGTLARNRTSFTLPMAGSNCEWWFESPHAITDAGYARVFAPGVNLRNTSEFWKVKRRCPRRSLGVWTAMHSPADRP